MDFLLLLFEIPECWMHLHLPTSAQEMFARFRGFPSPAHFLVARLFGLWERTDLVAGPNDACRVEESITATWLTATLV